MKESISFLGWLNWVHIVGESSRVLGLWGGGSDVFGSDFGSGFGFGEFGLGISWLLKELLLLKLFHFYIINSLN